MLSPHPPGRRTHAYFSRRISHRAVSIQFRNSLERPKSQNEDHLDVDVSHEIHGFPNSHQKCGDKAYISRSISIIHAFQSKFQKSWLRQRSFVWVNAFWPSSTVGKQRAGLKSAGRRSQWVSACNPRCFRTLPNSARIRVTLWVAFTGHIFGGCFHRIRRSANRATSFSG